jgi:hypothetical protein
LRGEATWIDNHSRAPYVRAVYLATPDWVNRFDLRVIQNHARRLGLVVDHIVPLNHALVCGLNVPWNLRIIDRLENAQRSNRWWEYTPDMFRGVPEQLTLL